MMFRAYSCMNEGPCHTPQALCLCIGAGKLPASFETAARSTDCRHGGTAGILRYFQQSEMLPEARVTARPSLEYCV